MTHSYTPAEAALLFIDSKKGKEMNAKSFDELAPRLERVNGVPSVKPIDTEEPTPVEGEDEGEDEESYENIKSDKDLPF